MSKHTPGPWKARKVGGPAFKNQVLWAIDFNEDQEQVVDFVYEEADARLIASAPDLLAALEGMIEVYGVCEQHLYREPFSHSVEVELCNQSRAAIARAKGEA